MYNMTYRDLKDLINTMTDEQLDTDVTINLRPDNEFFVSCKLDISDENCDVLDPGHPYIVVNTQDE